MLRISDQSIAARRVQDAEWEEASSGWASDAAAVTVLEEKAANTWRALDIEELSEYGGGLTRSGVSIGPESALRVAAVFACRRVIGEDVAKMPRLVRQVTFDDAGRQKTRTLWPQSTAQNPVDARMAAVARVLQLSPCPWLTPMQFFEWLVGTAVTQRAAYAVPTYDNSGRILELLPIVPGSVSVHQNSDWDVEYLVTTEHGTQTYSPGQILQLTGPVNSNLLDGYSVSSLAREAIGLAQAIEQSQARFHANDQRPSGVLTTKASLKPGQREAIRDAWVSAYGPGGSGGVAVLDSEFDYKTLNVTAADSQTLQNRDHQVSEICRYFRVFPQLIGHSGGLQGYGTFEQAIENHTKLTLLPWVERLEQSLMKALLRPEDLALGYRIHIDVDAIARGTFSDRVKAYGDAVKVFMSPNEIREREGMDPIDDETMHRVQLLANNTGMQQGGAKPKPAGEAAPDKQPARTESKP